MGGRSKEIMAESPGASLNKLFERFLAARPGPEESNELDRMTPGLQDWVGRIIWRRAGGRQRFSTRQTTLEQDVEDMITWTVVRVVQAAKAAKGEADRGLEDLHSYSAAAAHRAFDAYLREKYPERSSLSSRIRYLLKHCEGLALWRTSEGSLVAGFEAWRGRPAIERGSRLDTLMTDPLKVIAPVSPKLPDVVAKVLDWLEEPMAIDDLVSSVGVLMGIREASQVQEAPDALGDVIERQADPSDIHHLSELRDYLKTLWNEVLDLSINQRAALLLNLRDHKGRGVIALLPITGVASIREIALSLGQDPEVFASHWGRLPFEDAQIAALMGITRQQVINLRMVARKKLERRLREAAEEKVGGFSDGR